jgi:hypothetical protein
MEFCFEIDPQVFFKSHQKDVTVCTFLRKEKIEKKSILQYNLILVDYEVELKTDD